MQGKSCDTSGKNFPASAGFSLTVRFIIIPIPGERLAGVALGPAEALPENLLETQIFILYPRPTESETQEMGFSNLHVDRHPGNSDTC